MRRLAPGVHTLEAPQRFFGLEVGARMTALSLDDGLLLHSPVPAPMEVVAALGAPRWAVAPNRFHHLYVGAYVAAGLEGWAAPGVARKQPEVAFTGTLEGDVQPFGDEVEVIPLRCFELASEVLLLHRPSRTLVVTDLVFHFQPDDPWLTRAGMALLGGYPGCSTTLLERVGFDRPTAREELSLLLDRDFDRLILSHGAVLESGGRDALARAFSWLGL